MSVIAKSPQPVRQGVLAGNRLAKNSEQLAIAQTILARAALHCKETVESVAGRVTRAVVNDPSQPPALIANCMRNIVEYFFKFARKKYLNSVLQMPELQDTKYQAFCRYINTHLVKRSIR